MGPLRVTIVQQPIVWHDPAANRRHFESLLMPLAGRTDLIVLPETFTTGFSMEVKSVGETAGGATTQWLQELAAKLGCAITGSVITEDQGSYYNRLLWVTPSELRHYDKRHLFRMGREHEHFTAGGSAWSVEWRSSRVCPLICYDLRFPVFSRRRPGLEYDVLIYVANWPAARSYAWRQLLIARAIENQSFVVGVNRIGADSKGVEHSGDSAVIDYLGQPLVTLGPVPAVTTVELNGTALQAFRERFPAHLDADKFTL
jgi:predicted amidohydrolase